MAYQTTAAEYTHLEVRKLRLVDLFDVLDKGIDDFRAKPTHLFFLAVIYPAATLFAAMVVGDGDLMPLVFPMLSGLVLVGPFVGLAMEEMSRHRERGLDMSWTTAFNFFKSPSFKDIAILGLLTIALFLLWVAVADTIYVMTIGDSWQVSVEDFTRSILTTRAGWALIIVGNFIGLLFAITSLCIGVVSFPLLLDRQVGVAVAVETSVRAVLANPVIMAVWGVIVGGSLLIGALPLLVGLAVVIPVLGHATWHLYRKVVV
ncbi:MAG: DUF2189 domain-containing protein [Rhodospirillaceae bacterium]|nr:MAG: DUF2189 domain-containing protein [Rhodospirillaceae bacterium]